VTAGAASTGNRARVWTRLVPRLPKTVAGRRRLTTFLTLTGAGALGYLATCFAYPRPILGRDHAIPRLVGLPTDQAERDASSLGFKVEIAGEEPDPEVPAGAVLWQTPPADLIVPQGTTISLTRSSGPAVVPVPDVTDFDLDLAGRVLTAAGLRVGTIDSVPGTSEPGVIVGTRPGAGSAETPGSTVDLLVSQGAATIEVPNVVGLDRNEARKRIEDAGFRLGRVSRREARRAPNTVLEQRPIGGLKATRGARIDLVISEGS
jgi:serine/threonine-protein kinase